MDNCPVSFTTENSNINQGCWTLLETELNRYGHIVAYVCLGVIGLQVSLENVKIPQNSQAAMFTRTH